MKLHPSSIRREIAVNFAAPCELVALFLPALLAAHHPFVLNVNSGLALVPKPGSAVYCATKAAVISLTQSAGLNLVKHGINVNAIAPGVVDGEHWDGVDAMFAKYENRPLGEKKRLVGAEVPYGRMGTAEDLTGMAIFLASSESDYIVAQTYNVDGGNWMN